MNENMKNNRCLNGFVISVGAYAYGTKAVVSNIAIAYADVESEVVKVVGHYVFNTNAQAYAGSEISTRVLADRMMQDASVIAVKQDRSNNEIIVDIVRDLNRYANNIQATKFYSLNASQDFALMSRLCHMARHPPISNYVNEHSTRTLGLWLSDEENRLCIDHASGEWHDITMRHYNRQFSRQEEVAITQAFLVVAINKYMRTGQLPQRIPIIIHDETTV